jgi:predicted phosphodiesterase
MRVALLADIHGNCFALHAVLAALRADAVERIVCLGDVAIFGPQPREALALLQSLACPVVMGNTDAWALDPKPHPMRNAETPYVNAIELWSAAQLTEADRTYIRTFPPTVTVDLNGATMLCYHGSPRSFHDSIVATTPTEALTPMLGETEALILAGGHTHQPFLRRFYDKIVLNPGSVGRAYEIWPDGTVHDSPWAEYALVSYHAGQVQVDLRRVPYDVKALRAYTRTTAMPHRDWWCKNWQ